MVLDYLKEKLEALDQSMKEGAVGTDALAECLSLQSCARLLTCFSRQGFFAQLLRTANAMFATLQSSLQATLASESLTACTPAPSEAAAAKLIRDIDSATSASLPDGAERVALLHSAVREHVLGTLAADPESPTHSLLPLTDASKKVADTYEGLLEKQVKEGIVRENALLNAGLHVAMRYKDAMDAKAEEIATDVSSHEIMDRLGAALQKLQSHQAAAVLDEGLEAKSGVDVGRESEALEREATSRAMVPAPSARSRSRRTSRISSPAANRDRGSSSPPALRCTGSLLSSRSPRAWRCSGRSRKVRGAAGPGRTGSRRTPTSRQ